MSLSTAIGIISDSIRRGESRQLIQKLSKTLGYIGCLAKGDNKEFAKVVFRNQIKYLFGTNRPVKGQTRERALAALHWLYLAQDSTDDDGVSHGYFPCNPHVSNGWRPSYPETTGYIIETLLNYAVQYDDDEPRQRALRMATWETMTQMPSGAVQGGTVCPPEEQIAAVFNTGMVLQGYTVILCENKLNHVLSAAYRAADFLVEDLDELGHFRSHGVFVGPEEIKTYNCLCALALYRFGEIVDDSRYKDAATCAVESALGEQQENGWIANNCLTNPNAPLLHTIAYALQGILEVGILSNNEKYIAAVSKGVDPLIEQISPAGFLHGRYYENWKPAVLSSCLTGNAQLAIICYRLFQISGNEKYRVAADRLVDFLKGLQVMDSLNPAINGAIAGSYPILGSYMSAGYPNWATKYFLDGLLLQDKLSNK